MDSCAEGVETQQQLSYLHREGCTEVQGYYYSKPKPIGEILEIIKSGFGAETTLLLSDCEDTAA